MKKEKESQEDVVKGIEDKEDLRFRNMIADQFDAYGGHDAVSEFLKIIEPFLNSDMIKGKDNLISQLEECRSIQDKDVFIDRIFSAAQPVLEFRDNNPEEFQRLKREGSKNLPINEVLSYNRALYETGGEQIFIHLDPVRFGDVSLNQIKDGLRELAQIIKEDESIKVINANSWITAKQPGLLEKFGFTIGKVLTDEEREKYFPGEKRQVRESSITREEFLKRYLTND